MINNLLLIAKTQPFDSCSSILPFLRIVRQAIMPLFQIGIPILLIVLGSVDLGKAVISSDDKEIKVATGRLGKRIAYAAVIFFMVTIVTIVMGVISKSGDKDINGNTGDWRGCWDQAAK